MSTDTSLTWWGHSTATIVDSGVRVLTDPVLTDGVAHLHRRRGPRPTADARRADVVVVSHLHADHLHVRSLAMVDARAVLVLPHGARRAVSGLARLRDRDIREVGPGEVVEVGALRIRAVPAEHDGRRHPLARRHADPLGYVIEGARHTYFAGDTDLWDGMADAVRRCDVALLPVGGWGPGLGEGHMTAERAAVAAGRLRARVAVPIHFGTLWPRGLGALASDEFLPPGADFVRAAASEAPATRAREMTPGQTLSVAD